MFLLDILSHRMSVIALNWLRVSTLASVTAVRPSSTSTINDANRLEFCKLRVVEATSDVGGTKDEKLPRER